MSDMIQSEAVYTWDEVSEALGVSYRELTNMISEGLESHTFSVHDDNPHHFFLGSDIIAFLVRRHRRPASVCLPDKLTAENGAKELLSAEFFEAIDDCDECDCSDSTECERCDDDGLLHYTRRVPVSWNTIKAIYQKIVANRYALLADRSPIEFDTGGKETKGDTDAQSTDDSSPTCHVCGKPTGLPHATTSDTLCFCSSGCHNKYRLELGAIRTCDLCGDRIIGSYCDRRGSKVYCSIACRRAHEKLLSQKERS